MSLKQKLFATWHRYIQTNFNGYYRSAPMVGKHRSYEHVDIQQNFDKYEQERKKQRLQLIEYRKKMKKGILEKELKLLDQLDSTKIDFISENQVTRELQSADQERKLVLKKQLEEINQSLQEIEKEKQDIVLLDQSIEKLEPDMILLRGADKKAVMSLINYYVFQSRYVSGVDLNPETQKNMEIVHYQIQNNLPLKRELLYEVVPELFEKEIGELEEYKQKLIEQRKPSLKTLETSVLQVTEKVKKPVDENDDKILQWKRQEMEMMMFVFDKGDMLCNKHDAYIQRKIISGLPNAEAVFDALAEKKLENDLPEDERAILIEYLELVKINDDYHDLLELNKIKVHKEQRVLDMPEFVKNHPVLSKVWSQKWEQFIQHSHDLSESHLLPRNTWESKLDKVLADQTKHDIESLIQESELQLKAKIGDDVPVRLHDRKNKDETLVKQVAIMADAMHAVEQNTQIESTEKEKKHRLALKDDQTNFYGSEERRILLSEVPKILYLNNQDPKTYNLHFWAVHFNIEPQKLKNIFNYIAYPIISDSDKIDTSKVLRFKAV